MILSGIKIFQKPPLTNFQRYLFTVRVRYAPSPTGFMHIGGLRTALFNYLFAKSQGGSFIVRIEDTDKNRQVEGSVENIFQTLKWLGITPDESIIHKGEHGPYIQSERLSIYKNVQKHLLKNSKAFPCFCKQTTLEVQKEGQPYDGKCRTLPFEQIKARIKNKEQYAVRIKSDLMPLPSHFSDQVFGELSFKGLDDFVIVRRNGWPTFHFANVIDDWQMKITHVMRGEEWLTNTNKHIYLYKVLGADVPKFIHLPLIKAMNGKKLAKRDPQYSVQSLKEGQYEVEAIRSFLYGLGLNRAEEEPKFQDNENSNTEQQKANEQPVKPSKSQKGVVLKLLSKAQMVSKFDFSKITRVPVKFDQKQLDFLNKQAIKVRWSSAQKSKEQMQYFLTKIHEFIPSSVSYPQQYKIKALSAVVQRLNFITDLTNFRYYFEEPNYSDQTSRKDFHKLFGVQARLTVRQTPENDIELSTAHCDPVLLQKNKKIIHNLRIILEHIIGPESYNETEIAKHISEFLFQSPSLKNEDVFHLLRFIISGHRSGPNITQACVIIGRDTILKRLARFSAL